MNDDSSTKKDEQFNLLNFYITKLKEHLTKITITKNDLKFEELLSMSKLIE